MNVNGLYEREEYNSIDLLKFVFSFMIVAIHSNLLEIDNSVVAWLIQSLLFRMGVPFFFVVSGFFLAKKLRSVGRDNAKECNNITKKYCQKLLPPLIFWGLVGLIFYVYDLIKQGKDFTKIIMYVCRTVAYPLSAMWFIFALIIGSIILTFIFVKFKSFKTIWLVYSIITYSYLLLCNNYFFIIEGTSLENFFRLYLKVFASARNGVFLSPTFMGIGFILSGLTVQERGYKYRVYLILGLIFSYIIYGVEAYLLFNKSSVDDKGFFISQVFVVTFLTMVAINFNLKINLPYKSIRRFSTTIYFVHSTIISILKIIFDFSYFGVYGGLVLFSSSAIIALIVAVLTSRIKNKKVHLIFG